MTYHPIRENTDDSEGVWLQFETPEQALRYRAESNARIQAVLDAHTDPVN